MKVIYELITENDNKFDIGISEKELLRIKEFCEETMNEILNNTLKDKSDDCKIVVKCKSIEDYK